MKSWEMVHWNVENDITFMSSQMFLCVTKSIKAYAGGCKL